MRLLVDLQGLQGVSRFRGLGRYSLNLVLGIAQVRPAIELELLLHGGGDQVVLAGLRDELAELLPQARQRVFDAPWPWIDGDPNSTERHKAAEAVRNSYIRQLAPDVVLVASLFEGADESVISIPPGSDRCRTGTGRPGPFTAVVGYDVLPLTDPTCRPPGPDLPAVYAHRLDSFCNADLILSISDYSTSQFLSALGDRVPPVRTIWGAPVPMTATAELARRGVLCVGGDTPRKNERATVAAFAQLPADMRAMDPLTISGRRRQSEVAGMWDFARGLGLSERDFRVVGAEVSDQRLADMYRSARLVVMPSLGEGLGLPVLEAWAQGTPAIASSTTSLGEVVDDDRFTFEPRDVPAQARLLKRCLTDAQFLAQATAHGQDRLEFFSWTQVAERALKYIDQLRSDRFEERSEGATTTAQCRPKLAFHSPWPPEQSGIARHAAAVVPQLAVSYEVTLVNDDPSAAEAARAQGLHVVRTRDFLANVDHYDRVVYNIGNNRDFHSLAAHVMGRVPGVVVLHDPDLVGLIRDCAVPLASNEACQRFGESGLVGLWDWTRPVGLDSLRTARGVIVHSQHAADGLTERASRPLPGNRVAVSPLVLISNVDIDRSRARMQLGIPESTLLICSFGRVFREKRVAVAWESVEALASKGRSVLFRAVGGADPDYEQELLASRDQRIGGLTGHLSDDEYEMWLAACDIAIQLRAVSRGETSAALVEALAADCSVIAESVGSFPEFARYGVRLVPSPPSPEMLTQALEQLISESTFNVDAQAFRTMHGPAAIASRYGSAIEDFYRLLGPTAFPSRDQAASEARNANALHATRPTVYWKDASDWRVRRGGATDWSTQLLGMLAESVAVRVVPVVCRATTERADQRIRNWVLDMDLVRSCAPSQRRSALDGLPAAVRPVPGDWLVIHQWSQPLPSRSDLEAWRALGGRIAALFSDPAPQEYPELCDPSSARPLAWLKSVIPSCDIVLTSSDAALKWLNQKVGAALPVRGAVLAGGCDVVFARPPIPELRRRLIGSRRVLVVSDGAPRAALKLLQWSVGGLNASGLDLELVVVGAGGPGYDLDPVPWMRVLNEPTAEEMRWELLNADLVVDADRLPSDTLVIQEALAHGCRVLVRESDVYRGLAGQQLDGQQRDAAGQALATFVLDNELAPAIRESLAKPRNPAQERVRPRPWTQVAAEFLELLAIDAPVREPDGCAGPKSVIASLVDRTE